MKSISWQEAFLILKKWRDDKIPVVFMEAITWKDEGEEPQERAAGSPLLITQVFSDSGTIETSSREASKLDLIGADFLYSGSPSDSPFPDSPDMFSSTLVADLHNGKTVMFSELKYPKPS